MPREGTKTISTILIGLEARIEIRYAPGGDENFGKAPPGGTSP